MNRLFKALLVLAWMVSRWARGERLPSAPTLARTQNPPRLQNGPRPLEPSDTRGDGEASKIRGWLWHAAVLIAVLAVGGLGVAVSGIVPIKASSGHWAVTRWFLNFSMSRSVSTHTLGMQAPPLDDFRLVLKGAAHYETGCRACHGSPALPHPRIAAAMTPEPPYLPETIPQWDPEELFYIVKHGVKFTGMPAWPTQQRDDEVWAVVAFLQQFPNLSEEQYQQLVSGVMEERGDVPPLEELAPLAPVQPETTDSDPAPPAVAESCARCHGREGQGRGAGAFPRLAGQRVVYLRASLEAFARGTRHSGIMGPLAAELSAAEIEQLADYYSALDAAPVAPPQDPSREAPSEGAIARGKAIAWGGIPARKVPACTACHGPTEHPRNPLYPVLAGQYAEYLRLQLELFKHQHRGGTQYAPIMHEFADQLSESQIRDVARYYESLGSSPGRGSSDSL